MRLKTGSARHTLGSYNVFLPYIPHNERVSQSRSNRKRRRNSPLLSSRAVDVARQALDEVGEGEVGQHVGVTGLAANVATHRFRAEVEGYPGWEWNAVVACAAGSQEITVNEVALVPAPEGTALQAPEWVPYVDRLRAGDLGPGDLMPPLPDDERLTTEENAREAVDVGVDKPHATYYLTRTGLDEAKKRWREGEYGPTSEFAEKAAMNCRSCAFFIPAAEPIGQNFGVCVNEFSADGVVVHATYGCGAHSETKAEEQPAVKPFDDEQTLYFHNP